MHQPRIPDDGGVAGSPLPPEGRARPRRPEEGLLGRLRALMSPPAAHAQCAPGGGGGSAESSPP